MQHETPLSIASDARNAYFNNQFIRHEAVMERGWGRGQATSWQAMVDYLGIRSDEIFDVLLDDAED